MSEETKAGPPDEEQTLAEGMKKLEELIQDIQIAMLTSVDEDGALHSRPMATQKLPFDGDLWFFTYADSHKVLEINKDHHVNVAYSAPDKNRYVSVSGLANLVTDQAKINGLYNPVLKAWFPDGPETPGIALLKISVSSAEYWDAPNNAMVKVAGLVKATLTRQPYQPGEHDTIDLQR
jgi:general stress protein 26